MYFVRHFYPVCITECLKLVYDIIETVLAEYLVQKLGFARAEAW